MNAHELIEQLVRLRAGRRTDEVVEMYADDAIIVCHEGTARGRAEIRSFLAGYRSAHGRFDLVSIDAVTECEDTIVFDATVETTLGMLQVAEVLVLDDAGLIRRHVPGLRGYWGQ